MTRPVLKKKPKPVLGRRATIAAAERPVKADSPGDHPEQAGGRWTFLTNHAHVLLLLARNPSMVLREVATLVKITERAVQRIIADLEEEGFIEREKVGRQNHYHIIHERRLKHAVEGHRTIGDLLRIIDDPR
ncbi:MAG TPA: winged helix-turn-helix domain-containing protein [Pirellulaceae bacterium]|jgi:DNA-binding HxlR family transcriptional regulator